MDGVHKMELVVQVEDEGALHVMPLCDDKLRLMLHQLALHNLVDVRSLAPAEDEKGRRFDA
jgi:hypothetical protein